MSTSMRVNGIGSLDYHFTKARFEVCFILLLDAPLLGLPRKKVRIESSWKGGEVRPTYSWNRDGHSYEPLPDWVPDWLCNIIAQLAYSQGAVCCTVEACNVYFRFSLDGLRNYERFLKAMARKMSKWAQGERCSCKTLRHLVNAAVY